MKWWRQHFSEVKKVFKGELTSHHDIKGVERVYCDDYRNSGANAISLAAFHGCNEIFLLGYDCSIKNGYHWHGKHEGKLTNCNSIKEWPPIFKRLSLELEGVRVVNLSRYTELECFERGEIEKWL